MRLTNVNQDGRWTVKDAFGKTLLWEQIPQKLYGAMCKLKDYEESGLSPQDVEELNEMTRWIPVTEAVPQTDEFVLVFVKSGECGNIRFERTVLIADYLDGEWCIDSYPDAEVEITHWMPMPAEPQ